MFWEMPRFYDLWRVNLCITIPRTNHLVTKEVLEFQDLYGERVITGWTASGLKLETVRQWNHGFYRVLPNVSGSNRISDVT